MRLARMRIRNFRCYQEETTIDLDDFTAFVGRNDAGKSTILDALALFFGEYKPDGDDASIAGDKKDLRVICEFSDLPDEVVIDTDHPTSLAAERLLNANGRLEIHRVFSGQNKTPKEYAIYAFAQHPTCANYDDLLYLKRAELKERAETLGVDLSSVDERVNSALRKAIWDSAENLEPEAREIDLEKEDAKKIWSVLSSQLPVFAVFHSDRKSTDQDDEAQSPMKSAVDAAIHARRLELDEIAKYVQNEVEGIARETVEKLREMDPELAGALNPRFAKPNWSKVFGISLTDDAQIPINKRGSGVRRLILLNFFRAQAERRLAEKDAPGVIYAIEEPETSQHPRNQKLLVSALRELSEQPGCQVIITTHTPVLVRDLSINSLRYIEQTEGSPVVHAGGENTYQHVSKALGILPDHNVRLFVGVEGMNDIDFLRSMSEILHAAGENVPELADLEQQGQIVFVPLGGSSLSLWTHRLAGLNRPEFHLYDRDKEPPTSAPYQAAADAINARDLAVAMITGKKEMENYIHPDAISDALGIDIQFGDFDDVPDLVAEQLHILNGGQAVWAEIDPEKKRKKVSRAKRRLNTEAVQAMSAARLDAIDTNGDFRSWLAEIARLHAD
jgi:putative ATP-dependent endonuclease of the OLD family